MGRDRESFLEFRGLEQGECVTGLANGLALGDVSSGQVGSEAAHVTSEVRDSSWTKSDRLWLVVYAGFSLGFLVYLGFVSSRLTFFWDDYETLLVIARDPVGQLFMSGAGHYGPLWRLIFTLQVLLFGSWFPGYVLVTGLFAVAGVWFVYRSIAALQRIPVWLGLAAAVVIFSAIGPLAQILIAVGSEWTSAFFFGTLATWLVVRRSPTWSWVSALVASGLCLNGTFPVYVVFFLAMLVAYRRRQMPLSGWWTTIRAMGAFWLWLPIAGIWAVVGSILGNVNATPYYELEDGSALQDAVARPAGVGIMIHDWAVLFSSWMAAPLLPSVLTVPLGVTTLTIEFSRFLALLGVAALAAVVVVIVVLRRVGSAAVAIAAPVLVALTLPVGTWALVIAYGRSDTIHIVRYATIWLPFATFFWAAAIALFLSGYSRSSRVTGFVLSALLVASATIGVWRFPTTIEQGADLDRNRLAWSVKQMEAWDTCLSQDKVLPIEEVSPRLDVDAFCEIRRFVDSHALFDRLRS